MTSSSRRAASPSYSQNRSIPASARTSSPAQSGYQILRVDEPQVLPDSSGTSSEEESLLEAMQECSRMLNGAPAGGRRTPPEETNRRRQLQNAVSPDSKPAAKPERRIQLRLSSDLVRILQAFRKAGRNPRRIVESSLWNDRRIKDAAAILRLNCKRR